MEQTNNSYMPIAMRFAVIFGLITTVIGLGMGYYVISAEPSQSIFIITSAFGIVTCLVGAFAGFFVVKSYAQSVPFSVPAGKGAVIGLVTGVLIAVVGFILTMIWQLVDPNLSENMVDAMVRSVDTMQVDQATRDAMIDGMRANDNSSLSAQLKTAGINMVVMGIVNLITGIIGAVVYSKKEESVY